jgi:hypothetical protein
MDLSSIEAVEKSDRRMKSLITGRYIKLVRAVDSMTGLIYFRIVNYGAKFPGVCLFCTFFFVPKIKIIKITRITDATPRRSEGFFYPVSVLSIRPKHNSPSRFLNRHRVSSRSAHGFSRFVWRSRPNANHRLKLLRPKIKIIKITRITDATPRRSEGFFYPAETQFTEPISQVSSRSAHGFLVLFGGHVPMQTTD